MSQRWYSLWHGSNLSVDFGHDADAALRYLGENADDLLDEDVSLIVFDEKGMAQVALVDARKASTERMFTEDEVRPLWKAAYDHRHSMSLKGLMAKEVDAFPAPDEWKKPEKTFNIDELYAVPEAGPFAACEICGSTTRMRCGRLGCV